METIRLNPVKIAVIAIVSIIVLVTALAVYNAIVYTGRYKVSVVVAPANSTVEVDGHRVNGEVIHLTPGQHTYIVSHENFRSVAGTITVVEKTDAEQTIIAGLEPINSDGEVYMDSIPEEYIAVETAGGIAADAKGDEFATKNPITRQLPYTNPLFTIGYRNDQEDKSGDAIIITIRAPSIYRDNAVTQIRNWGYNPANYNIEFVDERNPFL